MSNYTNVKEFMQKFGQEVPTKLGFPSREVRLLRAKLILEEALEAVTALGFEARFEDTGSLIEANNCDLIDYEDPDMIAVLDALIDLDVVARCGTAIALGIPEECIREAEEEVSRSNLSKLWSSIEVENYCVIEANSCNLIEVENYCAQQVTGYIFESAGPNKFIARNKHGKVIKSPSYSAANLKSILEKYGYANNLKRRRI